MKKIICLAYLIFLVSCGDATASPKIVESYRKLLGESISSLEKNDDYSITKTRLPAHEPEEYLEVYKLQYEGGSFIAIGDDRIERLIFRDSAFETGEGVRVGQSFCGVVKKYPGVVFKFSFDQGVVLQLIAHSGGLVFNFATSDLPIGKFVTEGIPTMNDSSLCESKLQDITIMQDDVRNSVSVNID